MSDINLLPEELKPSGSVLKISAKLNKIALLGVVVLLISIIISLGAYLLLGQRLSASLVKQEDLKVQIKALEKTEQRLVLVKDRLTKISSVSSKPRANDEVEKLSFVSGLFPEGSIVERLELDKNDARISISADNLRTIASYLASVISSGEYTKINLVSLEFNPKEGYIVELSFP